MSKVAIPDWNPRGVLPPNNPNAPKSWDRSPYTVSLTDLILRFGTSPERNTILSGFLKFRSALHAAGLVDGFQWVNGSFVENIETIQERSPFDIDTVTFFHLPDGKTEQSLASSAPRLFENDKIKQDYSVDAYFVSLTCEKPEPLVAQSAYWYSIWSHRRRGEWKGYLQIDLSSTDDAEAQANLDKMTLRGDRP